MSKLEVGVEKAKIARLHCRGVNITYFEQALVEQQDNNNPNAGNMCCLDLELSSA